MNKFNKIALPAVLVPALFMTACNEEKSKDGASTSPVSTEIVIETTEDKLSYLMGYSSASQISEAGMTLSQEIIVKAIQDAQAGLPSQVDDVEARKVGAEFQRLLQEKRADTVRAKNIELGEVYLKQNAERKEVSQTASGIQYEILTSAKEGAVKPKLEDSVKVNYHGTLLDGSVFDSSVDRGEPVTFGVGQVIAGWTEVLQLMSEGDKWKVVIPGDLAYPNGTRTIQPGSTLIFEIELLEVNPAS